MVEGEGDGSTLAFAGPVTNLIAGTLNGGTYFAEGSTLGFGSEISVFGVVAEVAGPSHGDIESFGSATGSEAALESTLTRVASGGDLRYVNSATAANVITVDGILESRFATLAGPGLTVDTGGTLLTEFGTITENVFNDGLFATDTDYDEGADQSSGKISGSISGSGTVTVGNGNGTGTGNGNGNGNGNGVLTDSGNVAVEEIQIGDRVVTQSGIRPVRWVGNRRVDRGSHPRPELVQSVRVRAGAFELGRPARDLVLPPDHSLSVDGVLIPVRHLVNGATVVPERVGSVYYYHVELSAHDVLFAEGLAAESYFDTGNRSLKPRLIKGELWCK